jgi:hypothetical protein
VKVGYAFVSFWPTGESRNYDATKGEFGRPKIIDPITAGGLGGVELLARYDYAGTMRRQVEFGLPGQLRPFGIDKFEFHGLCQIATGKGSALMRVMFRE